MSSRSAHHTIAGYHYQFDKSILEIVRATAVQSVTLEGVEDVDVEGECIQCKYHSSQDYHRHTLKAPISRFIEHYLQSGGGKHYTLYAHFATNSPSSIDESELKAILGKAKGELGLTDAQLSHFHTQCFRFQPASDIDKQHAEVVGALAAALSSSREDCEEYYYGNALHEVMRLSRQSTISDRTTTRSAFLKVVDKKRIVFSRWVAEIHGQKDYANHVKAEFGRTGALRSARRRFVLLRSDILARSSAPDTVAFCRELADRHYALGKVLSNTFPFTVILDSDKAVVQEVQRGLVSENIPLNTGYETLGFVPTLFDALPVINLKTTSDTTKPGSIVSKASYRLRVIGYHTYAKHQAHLAAPDTFISVGQPPEFSLPSKSQLFQINDVKTLSWLNHILS